MTLKIRYLLYFLLIGLSSCISNRSLQPWPEILPEQTYFEQAYQADPVNSVRQSKTEYLNWVVDFYQGTLLYPQGWTKLSATVLAMSSPSHQLEIAPRMGEAGRLIAAEWAKDNSIRRIDNRLLSLWGSVIQVADSDAKRTETIDLIVSDVNDLTADVLPPVEINDERYNRLLQVELFDSF